MQGRIHKYLEFSKVFTARYDINIKIKKDEIIQMDIVQADIDSIIVDKGLFIPFMDSTMLITGSTGLIGSMLIKTIYMANKRYGLRIKIIGHVRDEAKAKRIFGKLYEKISFVKSFDDSYDYIVHTASPTASKFFIEHPVETIQSSVGSTMEILEVAKRCGATMLYLSSMEQYGVPYELGQRMKEENIGIIDHLNIRSSYSEAKRLCECLCAAYSNEYGVNVKIARLAQTFGAGVSLTDNRMPIQFARAVTEGNDIVLHTKGNSLVNFVYLTDAIAGILTILEKGEAGQAYNVCNDRETRSVREIAELICNEITNRTIKVQIKKNDNMGYAPDTIMYLNSEKLKNLGWKPQIDMKTAYRRLVQYIQESQNNK